LTIRTIGAVALERGRRKETLLRRIFIAAFVCAALAASLLANSSNTAVARPHGSPSPSPSPSESPTPTPQERIATLTQTVHDNPNDRAAHAELGVLLVTTGNPSQGRDELESARRLGLEDAQLWFYIGVADRELGDVPDAAGALEEARKFDPANQAVLSNLADTYLQLNRISDAARIANSAITLYPKQGFGYEALGTVQLDQGKFEQGRKTLQQAIALDPTDTRAKILIARSYLAQAKPDPDAALTQINPILAVDPKNAPALSAKADALAAKNDIPGAVAVLQQIVKLSPDDVRPEDDVAEFYLNKKMMTEARAAFAQAIKDHPKSPEPFALQADYDRHHNNFAQAASEYESALALAPNDPQLLFAAGQLYLIVLKQPTKAQDKFSALVNVSAGNSEALFWLGQAYAAENQWAQARDEFQRSFGIDHTYASLFNLGLSFYNLKDYKRARDAFVALAAHQSKDHPDVQLWYVLGDTLRKLGDKKGALAAYKEFIALVPKGAASAKAKAYIKQLGG
jgi:tetratricopeptide (TPR) repeat protein